MAPLMFPDVPDPGDYPDWFASSQLESRIYRAFREHLDEEYWVFAGLPYRIHDNRPSAWPGEIDFVVGHPTIGLLFIEVKGRPLKVELTGNGAHWQTYNGHPLRGRDPVSQVTGGLHRYKDELKKALHTAPGKGWMDWLVLWGRDAMPRLPEGHAWRGRFCNAEAAVQNPREFLGDVAKKFELDGAWLRSEATSQAVLNVFFPAYRNVRMLSVDQAGNINLRGIGPVVDAVEHSLELNTSFGVENILDHVDDRVAREEKQLALTKPQDAAVNAPAGVHVVVDGPPGTGKTVVAQRRAEVLSEQGEGARILVTCKAPGIAALLQQRLAACDGVEVVAADALPDLDKAHYFDTAIIDEAQLLREKDFKTIRGLVRDDAETPLFVLLDTDQLADAAPADRLISRLPRERYLWFTLHENLRNCAEVLRPAERALRTERRTRVRAQGPKPVAIAFAMKDDEAPASLSGRLGTAAGRYVREFLRYGLSPGQIGVVNGDTEIRIRLQRMMIQSVAPGASACYEPRYFGTCRDQVAVGTTADFQGLEREAILFIPDLFADYADDLYARRQAYVAMTRARAVLIVIAPEEVLEALDLIPAERQ